MNVNDEIQLVISKVTNMGAGIAKYDGFVIFVNNACPGDVVRARITKVNKNYATSEIAEIIKPSNYRAEPFCPMQKVCGSCQLQYIDYDYQLKIKKQITEDAIKSIGGLDILIKDTVPSPQNKNYRHKIQYPIAQTKNSKRILAGYYKPKSHDIVNIKYCPIQPEICDKIIEFVRENASKYGISGYNERNQSGVLRHVVIRNSASNGNNLVVLVINSENVSNNVIKFANVLYETIDEVSGVCVNFNQKKTNVILGEKNECLCGKDFIEEKILDKTFRIGANTFFQINPKSAENIFKYVKHYIKENFENPVVLDAYAGISSFGICVSDVCKSVVSVEENSESCDLAKIVAKQNNVNNIEINCMDAGKFFAQENRKFDAVILDPPRKGCSTQSLEEAYRLTKSDIIYVSCNPATLARDLKYLCERGCSVESIQPFDMFCHTYHVENVAIIHKN